MPRSQAHSLCCEVFFGPISQVSHAKNTVCNESLNIGHRMHRTAKVSPVVNQGIGDTASRKNEQLNSRAMTRLTPFSWHPDVAHPLWFVGQWLERSQT
jgi:hypothetical protein